MHSYIQKSSITYSDNNQRMQLDRINNNGVFNANYKHINNNLGVYERNFNNQQQLNDFINSYNIIMDDDNSSNLIKGDSSIHKKRTKKRTKRRSHRKIIDGKQRSICKDYLGEKIGININEGIYKSREQAIAVAYSQVKTKYPQCKRILGIRSKKRSTRKSRK